MICALASASLRDASYGGKYNPFGGLWYTYWRFTFADGVDDDDNGDGVVDVDTIDSVELDANDVEHIEISRKTFI